MLLQFSTAWKSKMSQQKWSKLNFVQGKERILWLVKWAIGQIWKKSNKRSLSQEKTCPSLLFPRIRHKYDVFVLKSTSAQRSNTSNWITKRTHSILYALCNIHSQKPNKPPSEPADPVKPITAPMLRYTCPNTITILVSECYTSTHIYSKSHRIGNQPDVARWIDLLCPYQSHIL